LLKGILVTEKVAVMGCAAWERFERGERLPGPELELGLELEPEPAPVAEPQRTPSG